MARQIQIGAIDLSSTALGVRFRGQKLIGWDGSPGTTLAVTQKPRDHGGWPSEAFLPSRILTLTGMISGSSPGTVTAAFDALNAAVALGPTTLTVTDDGVGPRTMTVYRQAEIIAIPNPTNLVRGFSIQFVAPDPRKYGPLVSVSTALPATSGGETWPVTWATSWTESVVSGVVSINNPGNISCPVQFRIDGAVVGPSVVHMTTSTSIVFSSSLSLALGEFLLVDTGKKSVLAQGQARRDGYVTSRGWFYMQPGANDWAFRGTPSASALLTITAPQGAWQ